MKPDFYELVTSSYDSYYRMGFYKTLDDCMLATFGDWVDNIRDASIIAYKFENGLPKKISDIPVIVNEFDEDLREIPDQNPLANFYNFVHYTFDDALVTLRLDKVIKP
jgi:hypothetical protein